MVLINNVVNCRLSGGAYLGYYHIGVAKTLWLEKLMPRVISGASAGSLIAGAIGYVVNIAALIDLFANQT